MTLRQVILGAFAAPLLCFAQTAQKLTATKATDYGLIYTLPIAEIDVTLEAQCVTERPGEFSKYAVKYLKAQPVATELTSWTLLSATISQRAVADADERYTVQYKGGNPVTMMLSADGAPLSVNDETYAPAPPAKPLPEAKAAEPTILERPVARQAMTQEMMQSTSVAKRAELAAAKIYELRETRNEILSGSADNMPPDGKALQLVLENLAAQEEALTAMFLGTRQVSTSVQSYTFRPGTESETVVIGRLSELDGLTSPDDLTGAPVRLTYTVTERGELPLTDRGEERRVPKGALAYRIPGTATVTVTFDGVKLASERLNIPQLGVVYGLDPSIFSDKKAPSYLHFDPLTGAVKETGAKAL